MNAIKIVRKNLANAHRLVENCIEELLSPYGEEGVTLNTHTDDSYAVISEICPNDFRIVESVRFYKGNLEMQFLGEKEWRILCFVDIGFLLDEICYALDIEDKGYCIYQKKSVPLSSQNKKKSV